MHLKMISWDDSCLGKLCGFPLCGQQTCVCGWVVQEQPGRLCLLWRGAGVCVQMHRFAELFLFPTVHTWAALASLI